jgi:hypothetical protein
MESTFLILIIGLSFVLEINGHKSSTLSNVKKCITNEIITNFNFVLEDPANDELIHFVFNSFQDNSETFISNEW